MSSNEDIPTRKEIQQFWINEFKNDVEDEIDQIQPQLFEQRQKYCEENQGSSNMLNRRRHYKGNREAGHMRLYNEYFSSEPIYGSEMFRRHFHMRKELFLRIVSKLETNYPYFQQRVDAAGKKGLSPLQKCVATIRQLAYGSSVDHYDEYVRDVETTAIVCLKFYRQGVIQQFSGQYLRRPNATDIQRLLQMHEQRHGFLGMLGSLDCMHWEWKNHPVVWKGQFTRGDHGSPTVILEVVASVDFMDMTCIFWDRWIT